MVREHKFMGRWPQHLSDRYEIHQSRNMWTAICGLVSSGRSLPSIAKSLDVDISGWGAMSRENFLLKLLAVASSLPEGGDSMMICQGMTA